MNKVRLLTSCAAVLGMMIGTAAQAQDSAAAQDSPAPTSSDQPPAGAAPSKTQAGNPATPGSGGEAIVVTGIRGSLQRAQDIKRRATSVVEAITAEDLGKFSDASVADAISRVPGAQITRNYDGVSGDTVSLRGLGSQYTVQSLNGRTLLTSGNQGSGIRGFNLDQIPSEVLGGVTIYKTPSAELIENGLAGLINYETVRPLNYAARKDDIVISLSARGDYDSDRKIVSPRLSATAILRNKSRTLGLILSGNYANQKRRTYQYFGIANYYTIKQQDASGTITSTPHVGAYDELNYGIGDLNDKRKTLVGGLQWRPSNTLEVFLDGTYNKYDRVPVARVARYIYGYGGVYDGTFSPGGITISNGHVTSVDPSRQTGGTPTQCYDDVFGQPNSCFLLTDSRNLNYLTEKTFGGNVRWHSGSWNVVFDAAHSSVNYRFHLNSWYNYSPGIVAPVNDPVDQVPQIALSPGNISTLLNTAPAVVDLNNFVVTTPGYSSPWFFGQEQLAQKFRNEARIDVSHDFSPNLKLKAGARYEFTREDYRAAQLGFAAALYGGGVPASAYALLPAAYFPGGNLTALGVTFPATSGPGACSVSAGICDVSPSNEPYFHGALPTESQFSNANGYQFDPSISRIFNERTVALYGQADATGTVFGWDASGNIGLRALNIRDQGKAYQGVRVLNNAAVQTPVSQSFNLVDEKHQYWELLPSFNANLHPTTNTSLRFGIARVISIPDVSTLSPAASVSIYDPTAPGYSASIPGFGSSGNINLKPTSSWNFDVTGELYTSTRGSVVASIFYKKISDFVLSEQLSRVPLPQFPGLVFDLSQPVNYSGAKAYGFEIGTYQPFTFLPAPWDGFGFQGNYTYVYSKLDKASAGVTYGIPGSSKHNANAILFYEKGKFGARAALTYRSDYFLFLGNPGYGGNFTRFEEGGTTVDVSADYHFNRAVSLQLQAANITKKRVFRYSFDKSFPLSVISTPATYSANLIVTF